MNLVELYINKRFPLIKSLETDILNKCISLTDNEIFILMNILAEIFGSYDITHYYFDSSNVQYENLEQALIDVSFYAGETQIYIRDMKTYEVISTGKDPLSSHIKFKSE